MSNDITIKRDTIKLTGHFKVLAGDLMVLLGSNLFDADSTEATTWVLDQEGRVFQRTISKAEFDNAPIVEFVGERPISV